MHLLSLGDVMSILLSIPWYAWIPIVAIVGGIIVQVVKLWHRHAERMAMIEAGMNPDSQGPQ